MLLELTRHLQPLFFGSLWGCLLLSKWALMLKDHQEPWSALRQSDKQIMPTGPLLKPRFYLKDQRQGCLLSLDSCLIWVKIFWKLSGVVSIAGQLSLTTFVVFRASPPISEALWCRKKSLTYKERLAGGEGRPKALEVCSSEPPLLGHSSWVSPMCELPRDPKNVPTLEMEHFLQRAWNVGHSSSKECFTRILALISLLLLPCEDQSMCIHMKGHLGYALSVQNHRTPRFVTICHMEPEHMSPTWDLDLGGLRSASRMIVSYVFFFFLPTDVQTASSIWWWEHFGRWLVIQGAIWSSPLLGEPFSSVWVLFATVSVNIPNLIGNERSEKRLEPIVAFVLGFRIKFCFSQRTFQFSFGKDEVKSKKSWPGFIFCNPRSLLLPRIQTPRKC